VNFARDVVEAAPPERPARVELGRDGNRREWSFGEVADRSARLAGTLQRHEVGRADVVMTLIGNRPEWVKTMVACFRIGAVVLPCNEQLRAHDLRLRLDIAQPKLIVTDERNRGTTGDPKGIVHGQRYLPGQRLQSEHWLDARPGDLVWCTAASGWSKSARNVFIAPWIRGATALLHDARFDPAERLQILAREQVNVLCMAPTEYRVIAKRATIAPVPSLRALVAAGEALNPEVLSAFREATGLDIRDGYGQTETGQLTGNPHDQPARPGSMGLPLPGVNLAVDDGELVLQDPRTDPTFFVRYLGGERAPEYAPWRTGDRVEQDEHGFLYFVGRTDDLIISAGYRIGPFEVESALVSHQAVAEAAVVAAPDELRGEVVRAVVVLRDGFTPSDELATALQDHVKSQTAPYKYPRIIEFATELPKTASGKVQRAVLRAG
jgi:acyl-coenzyme A synthetase/AMP-(fatty) acid ligase